MLNNPDLMRQAASMMGGGGPGAMGGIGGMDPSMLNNPSIKGFLANPDFLNNAVNMMKNPGMQAMM